jgi:hypothetical protein
MPRSFTATRLSNATRRALIEGSRHTVITPLRAEYSKADLEVIAKPTLLCREYNDVIAQPCTCHDAERSACCFSCAADDDCDRCTLLLVLSGMIDYAYYCSDRLQDEVSRLTTFSAEAMSTTFSAEAVSTKGVKKDRSRWNHAPTRSRLQGKDAKRHVRDRSSKIDL